MKAGEFLKSIAKKGDVDGQKLADFIASKEFTTIQDVEIPNEITNRIDYTLMSVEAAKAHPEVRKIIKSETLNGADSVIEKVLTKLGYDESDIADLKAEKNTFQRIEKLADKIQALESKKAGGKSKDKETYDKEIEKLNESIRSLKESGENTVKDLTKKHQEQLTDYELRTLIASKKLALPEDMPASLKTQTALIAVKNELAAKGYQIVNNEVKKADGTDAYDASNRKIDLTGLIEGALAQNKLLATVDPKSATPPVVVPGKTGTPNLSAMEQIAASIKDHGLPA